MEGATLERQITDHIAALCALRDPHTLPALGGSAVPVRVRTPVDPAVRARAILALDRAAKFMMVCPIVALWVVEHAEDMLEACEKASRDEQEMLAGALRNVLRRV
jgi:hypothetical protein